MLRSDHHEVSQALPVLAPHPEFYESNLPLPIIIRPSFWTPDQSDESTLLIREPESVPIYETRIGLSQEPNSSQHLRPMSAPPRAPVSSRSMSINAPIPASASSETTIPSDSVAMELSSERALWPHMRVSKQHESTVDYKNPSLGNRPPKYPRRARRQGLEGRVVIGVSVSRQGHPREVFVRESSGMEIFDHAALTAVKQWRFLPAKRDGATVKTSVLIPIVFRLHDERTTMLE